MYSFENFFPDCHFVTAYINYAKKLTDAPYEFHEAAALCLLAQAASCLYLPTSFENIYPNLYIILVAPSTLFHKSTALKKAREILSSAIPSCLLADNSTPTALAEQLHERNGQPSLWWVDEFGDVLLFAKRQHFMEGLTRDLLTYYDRRDYDYRRASKKGSPDIIHIEDMKFSVLTGSTVPSLMHSTSQNDIHTGFWPRFAIIYCQDKPPRMPISLERIEHQQEKNLLIHKLRRIYDWAYRLKNKRVDIEKPALDALNNYCASLTDPAEHSPTDLIFNGRLETMTMKIAILTAAGRGDTSLDRLTITSADIAIAICVAERWRALRKEFLLAFLPEQPFGEQKIVELSEKVMDYILPLFRKGEKVNRRDIMRKFHVSGKTFAAIEATLLDRQEILIQEEGRKKYWMPYQEEEEEKKQSPNRDLPPTFDMRPTPNAVTHFAALFAQKETPGV